MDGLVVQKWRNPSQTPIYGAWINMRQRCYNEKHPAFHNYGGRGIKICDRWLNDFDAFADDIGPRPVGYTLERTDNNAGYDPFNCIWGTRKIQASNRRKANRTHYSPHGSRKRYERYGCRCDLCKQANTEYARQSRARQRIKKQG